MKEKIIVVSIAIIVVIGAIFTASVIKGEEEKEQKIIVSEKVTDECTEEYEISMRDEEVTEASSSDEKLSANSAMVLKKYFKGCEHTINEYAEIPSELVNLTQEEIIKQFPEWELIGFTSNEVVLFKEVNGQCGEHFTLREVERKNNNIQSIRRWNRRDI